MRVKLPYLDCYNERLSAFRLSLYHKCSLKQYRMKRKELTRFQLVLFILLIKNYKFHRAAGGVFFHQFCRSGEDRAFTIRFLALAKTGSHADAFPRSSRFYQVLQALYGANSYAVSQSLEMSSIAVVSFSC